MGQSSSSSSVENPKILSSDMVNNCNDIDFEILNFLPEDNITFIKSTLQEGRTDEAVSMIKMMLNDMDNANLDIAVTGESGSGKSTFINAFREVGHEDDQAAGTGVVETTTKIIAYEHPALPKVKLWDLPGIGTPNFQPQNYLKQVEFQSYDFFLIISSSRFRDNDVKLAKEIREMGKKFYFIRTKVDTDVYNERRCKPKTFKKEKVLQEIRKNCLENLQKAEIEEPQVFLISSFELQSYDFPQLKDTLVKELPEHKRHVFILSLPNISMDILDQKKTAIQSKIWLKALKTGLLATFPCIGVIREADVGRLKKILTHYQRQFGIDEASLFKITQDLNKPIEEVKALLKSPHLFTVKKNESICEKLLKGTEIFCSVNGGLLATGLYCRKSYNTRLYFLDTVVEDAKLLLCKSWESSV